LTDDFSSIITELEQQLGAIDRALAALREISGPAPRRPGRPRKDGSADVPAATEAAPKKRVLSPEGRRRIIAATKRRWAEKRAQEAQEAAPAPKKRRGLTAAGRKRLSEMMKARWASNNPPKKRARA
jgi:hypothetical protein